MKNQQQSYKKIKSRGRKNSTSAFNPNFFSVTKKAAYASFLITSTPL
jgi:hypothetical protein